MRYALVFVALIYGCAGIRDIESHPQPTADHPIPMCRVTCGSGMRMLFGHQHICSGGASVFFTDFWATGRYTERGADGAVTRDVWTSRDGDFPVQDVETMRCTSYIQMRISSRAVEQRGVHPGEDGQGNPIHP